MKRDLWPAFLILLPLTACGTEPPAGTPEPSWGEAIHGLRLRIEAPQARYGASERMVFQVEAENVSAAPIRLPFFNDAMWHYQVRFESLDGGPAFVGGSGLFVDFREPPDQVLEPGATWAREADLSEERRRYLRIIEGRKPGDDWDYRDHLPPGRWRATLTYARESDRREGLWKGTAVSNALEITVAETE